MKKFTFTVKYEIGETIKHDGGFYKVIGYEFVKSRGIRYILLTKEGKITWDYLFDFEIQMLD